MANITKSVFVKFSPEVVDMPVVYRLVKDFRLIPNIIKADINPQNQGYLVMTLSGEEDDYCRGVDYLKEKGLEVEALVDRITWDEKTCTQCGACTAVCPSSALSIKRPQMNVEFDGGKCIVCNMCIQACPVGAVKLDI